MTRFTSPEHFATLNRNPQPGKVLTRRERRVLELVAEGLTNEEIGARLYYQEGTVKTMFWRIRIKLAAPNRAAAVDRGWRMGYLGERQCQK